MKQAKKKEVTFVKREKNADVRIVPPDTYPGKPPKNYKKKRAVSLFVCFSQSFGPACYELIRVKTTAGSDDMYSIYYPKTQRDSNFYFHESIHESGEIHWVMDGRNVGTPAYGRKDNPAAMRLYLRGCPTKITAIAAKKYTHQQTNNRTTKDPKYEKLSRSTTNNPK